jgi:uncharacterized protein (DUF58 family)
MSRRGIVVLLLGVTLLLCALALRNGTLALVSLPFLAYVATALWEAPPAGLRLAAERTTSSTRDGEAAEVHVTVRVRNEGPTVAALRLADPVPDGVEIRSGSTGKLGSLRGDQAMELDYSFRAPRGVFQWETVRAVASDPFGLFPRALSLPAASETVLRPRVRKFRPFSLHPERTVRSPGSVLGGRAGTGTDFWGVREYQPGDQMRRLDWRRSARHPGRLYTREHEQEDIADVGLVLDVRAQANLRSGRRELAECSIDAAASLAEMFLRGGNRVGMIVIGTAMTVVYPGYGKVQLYRVLRALAEIGSRGEPSPYTMDRAPLRVFSPRAIIVVLSPLTGREWQVFPRLLARGNEGLLVSADPVDFTRHAARDPVERLAHRAARLERRLDLRRIAQLGIRVVDWSVDAPLAPLVRRALRPSRGRAG